MVVAGKYELAGVVAEDAEWRTYQAREIATGRAVVVHQYLGLTPSMDAARRLAPALDILTSDGGHYVVTEAPHPAAEPERFTRVGVWRVPQGQPAPPPLEPPAHAASVEPSDFTRMFQSPAAPRPQTPAPAPAPQAPQEPGEFTRMFRTSSPGKPPAFPSPSIPGPSSRGEQPGEFTRFFQSPLGEAAPERSPLGAPPPPTAQVTPAPQPGEYTRLFQTPAPPVQPTSASGATGAFLAPSTPASALPAPVDAGPSDYTRMMSAQPLPAASAKPAEQPKEPVPTRRPGIPGWLILVLTFMGALALGMLLYFALRR